MGQALLQFLQSEFEANSGRYLDEYRDFLRFKSVSTDPQFEGECASCAEWLVGHLNRLGVAAELRRTPAKPVVFAALPGRSDRPKILFYGHYDVQPVDPLELWTSDPFEPVMRGERLYARGSSDDKGQVFFVLKAVEALLRANRIGSPLTILLEGEEESGSSGLDAKVADWARELKADILMVCDTGALAPKVPCITMGLRGLISAEIKLHGIVRDLHSGSHGGLVKNPAIELARLVAGLHTPDGAISIPGYYQGVTPFTPREKERSARSNVDPVAYEKEIGVPPVGGEASLSITERRGLRPTIEVNGFHSGYGGPGGKTIIPAEAIVKITSRLVSEQDPERCLTLLLEHITQSAPRGLKLEIVSSHVGGPAIRLDADSPLLARVEGILKEISGSDPDFTWEGGSIPVVAKLQKVSGAEPLLVGFGLDEDAIHAPNESFSWEQFRQGFLYAGMLLAAE